MFARLVILFTVFPLIELTLLILLGKYTSVWIAVGFVLVTGLIGASLLRWQGLQAWRKVQAELRAGQMPTTSLLDGFLILLASVLLISPGVLTDLVGITLLIPAFRKFYAALLLWYFQIRFASSFRGAGFDGDALAPRPRTEVIDSYVVDSRQGEIPDKND
jgi:UPF0716 protein FxsA